MITTKTTYGLEFLRELNDTTPVRVADTEIGKKQKNYIEQIATRLRRAGIIKSQRGPGGGYVLTKQPNELTVLDILLALEKQPVPNPEKSLTTNGQTVLQNLGTKITQNFEQVTLEDLKKQ